MAKAKRIITAKEKKRLKEEIKQIVAKRKEKGLTQTSFGKLIGRSASNIGNIEAGQLWPNQAWLDRANVALNLVNGKKSKMPSLKKNAKQLRKDMDDAGIKKNKNIKPSKKQGASEIEDAYKGLSGKYQNIFNTLIGATLRILEDNK